MTMYLTVFCIINSVFLAFGASSVSQQTTNNPAKDLLVWRHSLGNYTSVLKKLIADEIAKKYQLQELSGMTTKYQELTTELRTVKSENILLKKRIGGVLKRANNTMAELEAIGDDALGYKRCQQFTNIPYGTTDIHDYAVEACRKRGGRLVRITSRKRHQEVKSCIDCSGMRFIFIDGILKADGKWYYDDDTEMTYVAWQSGQPNNVGSSQPYAALECNKLQFNDMWPIFRYPATTNNSAYVCEFL